MNKREAAIVTAHTGILLGDFNDFHKYIEQILERPVYTHELADQNVWEEIKNKSIKDFCDIEVTNDNINEQTAQDIFSWIYKNLVNLNFVTGNVEINLSALNNFANAYGVDVFNIFKQGGKE